MKGSNTGELFSVSLKEIIMRFVRIVKISGERERERERKSESQRGINYLKDEKTILSRLAKTSLLPLSKEGPPSRADGKDSAVNLIEHVICFKLLTGILTFFFFDAKFCKSFFIKFMTAHVIWNFLEFCIMNLIAFLFPKS